MHLPSNVLKPVLSTHTNSRSLFSNHFKYVWIPLCETDISRYPINATDVCIPYYQNQIFVFLLALFLGVSSLAIPRSLDSVEDLSERDSGDYDLYVRAPTKNVAQHNNHAAMHSMMATQHAKKEHKTAVKAAKKAGTAPPPKLAKVKHPKLSATAKAEVKAHFNHASTLHKATTGLPGRKDTFTPQHGTSKSLISSSYGSGTH